MPIINCTKANIGSGIALTVWSGFLRKLPQVNSAVAVSTNQGTNWVKKVTGVLSNNIAPNKPPATLSTNNFFKSSRPTPPANLRPAREEVIWLGNKANVEVIFADNGSNPANSNVGKVIKEPPPARVF